MKLIIGFLLFSSVSCSDKTKKSVTEQHTGRQEIKKIAQDIPSEIQKEKDCDEKAKIEKKIESLNLTNNDEGCSIDRK